LIGAYYTYVRKPNLDHPVANTVPEISIIIPTLNEEEHIGSLIRHLTDNEYCVEIIVADGGSLDRTVEIATKLGALSVTVDEPSRPEQLNAGARLANAALLYFVHADTLPPRSYANQILDAAKDENTFGSFRFKFDSERPNLKFNSWCTRLPVMMVRGGDQSLFISRKLFDRLDGYREDHIVMEDYDIIRRGKGIGKFQLLQDDVIVSARKYEENPYWKVNISNFVVFTLYYWGVQPVKLFALYKRMIAHPKA
jgi:rSAM/selenodomain-associated transferase 2